MSTKNFTFQLEGTSENEVNETAKALNIIYQNTANDALIYLAKKISENPKLIAKAVSALKAGLIR